MAHYRKIDVAIWNDEVFMSLRPNGKLAFFMLITHPNMTGIGAMRATVAGLSAEVGIPAKDFSEIFDKGLAHIDEKSNCVFLPSFVKYQSAESPNVIKNWVKQLQFIPEGLLKAKAIGSLLDFLEGKSEGFMKAFLEAYRKEYRKDLSYTVSSKQLAVSKPPIPSIDEPWETTEREGGQPPKIGVIDPATGEVMSRAVGGAK